MNMKRSATKFSANLVCGVFHRVDIMIQPPTLKPAHEARHKARKNKVEVNPRVPWVVVIGTAEVRETETVLPGGICALSER